MPRSPHASARPWGAPRIHGELVALGLDVCERTVSRYRPRARRPPSQTWRAFLANHLHDLVSIDFFTVPTATFQVLFVFVVISHTGRRVVHWNVTAHPTAAWAAQQIVEAFPWDTAPRYLLHDRDGLFVNTIVSRRVASLGISDRRTASRSPWQNPYVERLIGSMRRECLDHIIVLRARHVAAHRIRRGSRPVSRTSSRRRHHTNEASDDRAGSRFDCVPATPMRGFGCQRSLDRSVIGEEQGLRRVSLLVLLTRHRGGLGAWR